MYKIIGADHKEYGPVSADQMRQWIREGRVGAQTKILPEGTTEWKTLGEIPELATALPSTLAPSPALTPGAASAAAQVKAPAIALIVTASLGIIYYLLSGVLTLAGGAMFRPEMPADIPPALRAFLQGMQGPLAGAINLAIVALNAFVLVGGVKILRLQSYRLGVAACIVAMLPCQCCCVLGLPFGIWALIVLSKPEVKVAFQ